MKSLRAILCLLASVILIAGIISCGGGGGGSGGGNTINVSGSWAGYYTINYSNSGADQTYIIITFTQNGSSISGTYSNEGCTGTIAGSVSGNNVSFDHASIICNDSGSATGTYSSGQINFNGSGTTSSENYTYYGILYKQ